MADLFHRVSIRKYQEKKVEPEKLDYILRASICLQPAAVGILHCGRSGDFRRTF